MHWDASVCIHGVSLCVYVHGVSVCVRASVHPTIHIYIPIVGVLCTYCGSTMYCGSTIAC